MALQGRYETLPMKCMACAAVQDKQEKWNNQQNKDTGIHWILIDHDREPD